jgi:putative iron-regulated protein
MRQRLVAFVSFFALAMLALTSCGDDQKSGTSASGDNAQLRRDVLETHAKLAWSLYNAALDGTKSVQAAVRRFLAAPDATSLAAARQAWLDARPAYLHTEAFRFSDGPIDSGDNLEGFINAWPLDESFIDSIIAGSEPITADTLHADNERGGEKNISTGWHAVEYLLWGKDTSVDGPGNRPASDFALNDPSAARRRTYLAVVTDLLVRDFTAVIEQWSPDNGAYRAEFVKLDPTEGLHRILTGLGTLSGGELFGQRMSTPFETKDQEDEHSCFSDNTTEDHKGDVDGIRRVYLGLGADSNKVGTALTDLVAAVDPSLDVTVRGSLDAAAAATAAIPRPFDQAIRGTDSAPGRVAIHAALDAVDAQTKSLVLIADKLHVKIATDVP